MNCNTTHYRANSSSVPGDPTIANAQTNTDSVRNHRIDKLLKVLGEFRVQAYAQVEWQRADTVGAKGYAGGNFPTLAQSRFLVRRGRLKLSYDHTSDKGFRVFEGAFQFDATEKGFNAIKDLYGRIIDPWTGWIGFQGGIFLRPFGYESPAPPALHESPEFARMNQIIMPNECEIGEAIVIESPKTFKPVYLRLDASLVNGEGVGNASTAPSATGGLATGSYQNAKDFIGRIKFGKTFETKAVQVGISGSASYYRGSVLQTDTFVYQEQKNTAGNMVYTNVSNAAGMNKNNYKREYYGAHLQLDLDYKIGTTMLRGEFIGGTLPGTATADGAPLGLGNAAPAPAAGSHLYLFVRQFNGGIFYLTQTFKAKLHNGHTMYNDITFKYDVFTPNTQVAQNKLSSSEDSKVSVADVRYATYGVGYVFRPYDYFKLMIWYDIVKNSTTSINNWGRDMPDNVLTIRTQFYFDSFWFNKNK